jgi:type I restriction enzyme S subunit
MSEWKPYKLDEIATKLGDGLHGTPKYDDAGEYYFINGSNLVNGKIVINSNTKRVTQEEYNKYRKDLSDRTILLGINGTIGNVALFNNEKCILGKSACYINVDNKFDKQFIKYVLLSDDFQNYIKTNATGTTIKNVGLKLIREYEALIPADINQQQEIASILSTLDDKIELNLQMNQTLEAMAQAIFKEWFVNFNFPGFDGELVDGLPKGWRIGKLNEIAKIEIGRTPPRIEEEWFSTDPKDIKWISIKDLGLSGAYIFNTSEYLTKEAVEKFRIPVIPENTVVLSFKLTIGRLAITTETMLSNEAIAQIKSENYSSEYIYTYLKTYNWGTLGSTSSIATAINSKIIKEMEVLIPDSKIEKQFQEVIKPIFEKLKTNSQEIETLTQIRDSLLPKLMTGKIEIQA